MTQGLSLEQAVYLTGKFTWALYVQRLQFLNCVVQTLPPLPRSRGVVDGAAEAHGSEPKETFSWVWTEKACGPYLWLRG